MSLSTAFGITCIVSGLTLARSAVFSFLWNEWSRLEINCLSSTFYAIISIHYIPGIGHTDNPIAQAECHAEQDIGDDRAGIGEAEQ